MDRGAALPPREPDEVRLSKLLAFVLRHRPDALGLALDPDGWVGLDALVGQINARRRLPFPIDRAAVQRLVTGEGRARFEVEGGRIRARSGHTVAGVDATTPGAGPDDAPEFLFAGVPLAALAQAQGSGAIEAGEGVRLHPDEGTASLDGPELLVVDAGRALRQGLEIRLDGDALVVPALPVRFVLSLRQGFERQISAGGVLVRGRGADAEFALIRTLPRGQVEADAAEAAAAEAAEAEAGLDDEPPEIQDARDGGDRRGQPDRRRVQLPPPGGVDRRQAPRRQRRRRRSGRWGPAGRLELPKGKLEPGETAEQAALREVREELGIDGVTLEVGAVLSSNHYAFRTPDQRFIFKTVHYFLVTCDGDPSFRPRLEEGIVSVEWWPGQRAVSQVAFKNLRPILERAWELVQGP